MADELPSLHIDNDWKKQAQEEKRRLAEEAQKRAAAPPASPIIGAPAAAAPAGPAAAVSPAGGRAARGRGGRPGRETPVAGFTTLIQSILTQTLFYLGDLAPRGTEPQVDLDMAKYQLDTLTMLESKTLNNLDAEEKSSLDVALHEGRMRFIAVASQYI